MDDRDLRLDGNAAAGVLQAALGFEVTSARGRCEGCGAVEPLGALLVYPHGPGVVLRCLHCQAVMVRLAELPQGYRIDLRGIRCLEITG